MITGGVEVVSTRRDQEIKYVNGLMGRAFGREAAGKGELAPSLSTLLPRSDTLMQDGVYVLRWVIMASRKKEYVETFKFSAFAYHLATYPLT